MFYFRNDIIPVVMGARKEDYEAMAPPDSFIHVDDFRSPQHLADYLHEVDSNYTLYKQYFRWRTLGSFVDTRFYCRLCSLLYSDHPTWYDDVSEWWNVDSMCVQSSLTNYFASWTTGGVSKSELRTKTDEENFTIKYPKMNMSALTYPEAP